MPSLSHESYPSTPDKNGHRQRLSIDALKPLRRKTAHSDIYDGKAFSSGRFSDDKHEKKMLAKFLKDSRSNKESHDFASHNINLNEDLENVARRFNDSMKHMMAMKGDLPGTQRSNQIHFQELQMAQLESVSFCDSKRRRKGEYFVFGEELPGCRVLVDMQRGTKDACMKMKRSKSVNFEERFPMRRNRLRTFSLRDNRDEVDESTYDDDHAHICLHAFVHFYSCHKNGEMVVDFLRGNYSDGRGYTLITPTVHSLSNGYGPTDCGEKGVRRVIDGHRCNALCRHLRAMQDVLDSHLSDARAREEEEAACESTGLNDHLYQQNVASESSCPSQDGQFRQDGAMCPTLSHYEQYWQEEGTVYKQCNAPSYGQSWQERTMYERREGALLEINCRFS